jgi:RimJ/RimL family protein N-acetyltransferase
MSLTRTERSILATDGELALAELFAGEKESLQARCDKTFDDDPDDRPVPFQVTRNAVALVELSTGEPLGTMTWRPVPYSPTVSGTAWNIGIHLLPVATGRGLSTAAGRLLVRYLFDTTEMNRVQAITDVANVPGWRGLERLGFHRDGVLRGVSVRDGEPRDMYIYAILRTEAHWDAKRTVLAQRSGVALAQAFPGDRSEVMAASDNAFGIDPDPRSSPATPPTVFRAAILDAGSRALLGITTWHAVDYGNTFGCAAWNIGITLKSAARGRGIGTTAQRLLAEHLFATTDLDRVEAGTDVDNHAERRSLEKAGFRLDGIIRGAQVRDGRRRDLAVYGLLRTDLG